MVNVPSAYNVILGRTGLNTFKGVPLTYHVKLKFPTPNGIPEVRGDQKMARNCYFMTLKTNVSAKQVLPVDSLDTRERSRAELGEELILVSLDEYEVDRVTYIGSYWTEKPHTPS
ncbi:hypothetical protein Scep_019208 [Stephania cephalantha]|uniref:Uncharacterized protein n=1 Tax=Stephania cephalantha TaxID=152367 RepID=A0AAP0IAE1_9MAGN